MPPDLRYDDTAQGKLDKLDALLALNFTPREDAALFSEMLSLTNDGRYPTLELSPPKRRQHTLERDYAGGNAGAFQSNLKIFEDAHWLDPTSFELLGRTMDGE